MPLQTSNNTSSPKENLKFEIKYLFLSLLFLWQITVLVELWLLLLDFSFGIWFLFCNLVWRWFYYIDFTWVAPPCCLSNNFFVNPRKNEKWKRLKSILKDSFKTVFTFFALLTLIRKKTVQSFLCVCVWKNSMTTNSS